VGVTAPGPTGFPAADAGAILRAKHQQMVNSVAFWHPKPTLDDEARRRGIRAFEADGVCSQIRDSLLSGPLLIGYALLLGASNTAIGALAALGPATQILQLPSVALIEHWRARKAICWWAALVGRSALVGMLALPWLSPVRARVPALFAVLLIAAALASISSAAWTPWIRDLLPDDTRNRVIAHRMALATGIGAALTLAAGIAVDALPARLGSLPNAYVAVMGAGVAAGLLGLIPLGRIPEPLMAPSTHRPWRDVLGAPLRNRDFRALVAFLATWTFAVNLSTPFFTVYLLRRLALPMAAVLAFTVLSQATSAVMLRAWGVVADRFSTLAVLRISSLGFLLSVAGWPVAGTLERPWLVVLVLAAVHLTAGVAAAGVNLCTGTVAMEVAPRGEAASYFATNAIVSGAAAGLAPLVAGVSADWLETQRFSVTFAWTSTLREGQRLALRPLDLHGLDFLFVATVLVGLYAVHRILGVVERQPADRRVVVGALADEVWERMAHPLRAITTVPGARDLVYFPFSLLGRLLPERRRGGGGDPRRGRRGIDRTRPP
jgi:MFS family permease